MTQISRRFSHRFLSAALRATAVLAALAMPAIAIAQEEHGGEKAGVMPTIEQGIVPMLVSIGVFAVVFAVLAVKVWPNIVKGLSDRENKIREEIESAELARQQAKDALEQYQQSLAQARAEAHKMLEQTKAQQLALAAELKSKADVELGQMRERAMRDIDAAKRAAVAEIYSDAANIASLVAGKILRREIRPSDQQALVEESLAKLQTVTT